MFIGGIIVGFVFNGEHFKELFRAKQLRISITERCFSDEEMCWLFQTDTYYRIKNRIIAQLIYSLHVM